MHRGGDNGPPVAEVGRTTGNVTAVLWDIDGTLVSSRGVVVRTFLDAVQAVCGTRPDPAGLEFGGRLDPEIARLLVRAAGGRTSQVDRVLATFETLVADRQDALRGHIDVLPGVRELVSLLADVAVTQTVVTGNPRARHRPSHTRPSGASSGLVRLTPTPVASGRSATRASAIRCTASTVASSLSRNSGRPRRSLSGLPAPRVVLR